MIANGSILSQGTGQMILAQMLGGSTINIAIGVILFIAAIAIVVVIVSRMPGVSIPPNILSALIAVAWILALAFIGIVGLYLLWRMSGGIG